MTDLANLIKRCPPLRWINYVLLWVRGGSERHEAWRGNKHHLRRITYDHHVDDEEAWSRSGKNWVEKWVLLPLASYRQSEWHVLEIGCGPGRLLAPLGAHFKKVVGIDFSEDMIQYARQRLQSLPNVLVLKNDGRTIPLADSSIDFVFSVIAFQHMDLLTIKSYFQEAYRVLRDSGFLRFQTRRDIKRRNASSYDRHFLSRTEVETLATEYGFDMFSYEPGLGHPKWHWFTLRKPPR